MTMIDLWNSSDFLSEMMDRFINSVEILAEMFLGYKAWNMLQHREVPLMVVYLLTPCSTVLL